ncbi:hypothetical protein PPACK8108_LOCUS7131 [Phakopsora pachyrhizi]|uniref:Extracellular serine-rich protein n=1 Tax=Phakopsora pachyrhizi TaxID=170000 RepID=A0AAV0AWN4_PHAPC|nr:hypothetical protein PPACK8108_LOCUS7131 [Phakopsora pachyrhizi]
MMKHYSRLLAFISALLVSRALASDFRVTVGISQITGQVGTGFDPNRIIPSAGDTITFTWLIPSYINNPTTGTYSVTQGSADSPCKPLGGGFDSGPKTTGPESAGQAPTMTFQVKDSNPLYFYSSVDNQCQKGMVLGVNTPASGQGSVESYIIAAGGNPNVDTTLNSSSTTNSTSTNSNITSTVSLNNSTTAKGSGTANNLNSTTTAKPKNGSAAINMIESMPVLLISALALAIFQI